MAAQKRYKDPETKNRITSFNELDPSLSYSYANYLTWLFDDRVELIKGKLRKMSPAPNRMHQQVSIHLASLLYVNLSSTPCKVYSAPFDVRFPVKSLLNKDIYTVLQPDICVICDAHKLDSKGCIGAPDVVAEILSPGNTKTDLFTKYKIYEEFGVKEYWIIDPLRGIFFKHILDDTGKYMPPIEFIGNDKFYSKLVPGFTLKIEELFAN